MDFESSTTSVLPTTRAKQPIRYLIVYPDPKGNGDKVHIADRRRDARAFINSLPDPSKVDCIYRITMKIPVKIKMTAGF